MIQGITKVKDYASDNPKCIFGVLDSPRGNEIEQEMIQWLRDWYNVTEIYHDGTQYEYPALRYMQDWCKENKQPCLYIHSRGAVNTFPTTVPCKRMWEHEFTINRDKYFEIVNVDRPVAACPFTGVGKFTFYNGFVANHLAMESIPPIEPNEDRFVFEDIFRNSDTEVVGTIYNDVRKGHLRNVRRYLYSNYG